VSLSCGAPQEGGIWLQRYENGAFHLTGMTVANDWSGVWINDYPPAGASALYRVCTGSSGTSCGAPTTVYLDESTCGSPPATGCGGGSCGGTSGGLPKGHPGHAT